MAPDRGSTGLKVVGATDAVSASRTGDLDSAVIAQLQNAGREAVAVLDQASSSEQRALLLALISRIDVSVAGLTIHFKLDAIDPLLAEEDDVKVAALLDWLTITPDRGDVLVTLSLIAHRHASALRRSYSE